MSYIKKKYNEKKIVLYHLYALIPLVLYGIYKNGFYLYYKNEVSLFSAFKPLLISICFILIVFIFKKLMKKDYSMNDFYMFSSLLFLPYIQNYLIVILLFIVFYFLSISKFKLPFNCIFLLTLYAILYIFGDLSFLNPLELTGNYNYNFLDYLLGKGDSYLFTSSILFSIVAYVFLSLKPYYKKIIPISFIIFYGLLVIVIGHFSNYDFTNIFGIFTAMTFIGASFSNTPNEKTKMCLYSLLVALGTVLFSFFFGYYIGIFISILLMQILSKYVFRKFFTL